jgi:hypothetical protein
LKLTLEAGDRRKPVQRSYAWNTLLDSVSGTVSPQ